MPRDARNDRPRTLTRRDLVDALERETGLSPDECRDHLEDVLATFLAVQPGLAMQRIDKIEPGDGAGFVGPCVPGHGQAIPWA